MSTWYHSWIYIIETTLKYIQEKKKGGDLNARVVREKKWFPAQSRNSSLNLLRSFGRRADSGALYNGYKPFLQSYQN